MPPPPLLLPPSLHPDPIPLFDISTSLKISSKPYKSSAPFWPSQSVFIYAENFSCQFNRKVNFSFINCSAGCKSFSFKDFTWKQNKKINLKNHSWISLTLEVKNSWAINVWNNVQCNLFNLFTLQNS